MAGAGGPGVQNVHQTLNRPGAVSQTLRQIGCTHVLTLRDLRQQILVTAKALAALAFTAGPAAPPPMPPETSNTYTGLGGSLTPNTTGTS